MCSFVKNFKLDTSLLFTKIRNDILLKKITTYFFSICLLLIVSTAFSHPKVLDYKDAKFIADKLIKVKKADKTGVIDTQGSVIIPVEYDNIQTLTDDSLLVSKDKKHGVVDLNNKVIIPLQYDDVLLRKNAYFLRKEHKTGLADLQGQLLTPIDFDNITRLNERFAKVYLDGEYQLFDLIKGELLPEKYSNILTRGNQLFEVISNNKQVTTLNGKGKVIISPPLLSAGYGKHVVVVKKGDKYGIIDYNGMPLSAIEYDYISVLSDFIQIIKDDKAGIYSLSGKKIVAPIYDGFESLRSDNPEKPWLFKVKKGKKWGLIDVNNKVIIDFLYDKIVFIQQDKLITKRNKQWQLVSLNSGKNLATLNYDEVINPNCSCKNVIVVKQGKKYGLLDNNGNEILAPSYALLYPRNDTFVQYRQNGKWGVIKVNGTPVLEAEYSDIWLRYGGGFMTVKEGKWQIMSALGKPLSKPYDKMFIQEDVYIVTQADKNGVVDYQGKVLIEPKFAKAGPLLAYGGNKHLIAVNMRKEKIFFNKNGTRVTATPYTGQHWQIKKDYLLLADSDTWYIIDMNTAKIILSNNTIAMPIMPYKNKN